MVFASSCGPDQSVGFKTQNHLDEAQTLDLAQQCLYSHTNLCYYKNVDKVLKEQSQVLSFQTQKRLELHRNYLLELSKLAPHKKPEQNRLVNKYRILNSLLSKELLSYQSESVDDASADTTASYTSKSYEFKDQILTGPNFTSVYHPLVLQEVNKVFKDFGPLYINESTFHNNKPKPEVVESERRPWSGYWYSFRDFQLYTQQNSPLGKFDQVLRNMGIQSNILDQEIMRYSGFNADGWEGLCDAWSLASVSTKEPLSGKIVAGVYFSPADLKALQTFSHLKYASTSYGLHYRGNSISDGTFQDLKPEAFHQLVVSVLGKERRALVVDDTSGVQVWNKPLYKYWWTIRKDPEIKDAYLVKAYAWYIKQRGSETNLATTSEDITVPNYNYRLYVDKNDQKNGKYRVIAGQWVEHSFDHHPDAVTYPHKFGSIGSHNSEFNKYLHIYRSHFLD